MHQQPAHILPRGHDESPRRASRQTHRQFRLDRQPHRGERSPPYVRRMLPNPARSGVDHQFRLSGRELLPRTRLGWKLEPVPQAESQRYSRPPGLVVICQKPGVSDRLSQLLLVAIQIEDTTVSFPILKVLSNGDLFHELLAVLRERELGERIRTRPRRSTFTQETRTPPQQRDVRAGNNSDRCLCACHRSNEHERSGWRRPCVRVTRCNQTCCARGCIGCHPTPSIIDVHLMSTLRQRVG